VEIPKAAAKSCKQDQYGNENDTALQRLSTNGLGGLRESGRPRIIQNSDKLLLQI
jgi:hypothetical protein